MWPFKRPNPDLAVTDKKILKEKEQRIICPICVPWDLPGADWSTITWKKCEQHGSK